MSPCTIFTKGTFGTFTRTLLFALLTCLGLVSSAQATDLKILSINCKRNQENDANGDEIRVEVIPDTTNKTQYSAVRKNVRPGVHPMSMTVHFRSKATLRLVEVDGAGDLIFAGDETLGSVPVYANPVTRTVTFKGHGSHYEVTYQVVSTPTFEVDLLNIRCLATQERDRDGDELRLDFRRDGGPETQLGRSGMTAGSVWVLNRKLSVLTNVRVQLIEVDGVGIHFQDEDLGSRFIRTSPATTSTVEFTGHGSRYVLSYRVRRN